MSLLRTEPFDDARFEALYDEYFGLLVSIAIKKFQVPDSDAEGLVHDVLLSYLKRSEAIHVLRPWLVGAICYASRHYWRLYGRNVPADAEIELNRVDPRSINILDSLPDQIAAREALECLQPRCQQILYMRYFEERTVPEIAAQLGVKSKYAAKLIQKCLRRAEKTFLEGQAGAAKSSPARTARGKSRR